MSSRLKDYTIEGTVDWGNRRVVQILEAAGRCFARSGYAETSIKDIATKVGVTKSMVHYYFTSKAHLMLEVLSFANQRHLQRVTQRLQVTGDSPLERAREALKSLWKTVREQRRFLRLTIEFWAVAARYPKLRQRLRETHAASRQLVAVGIEDALGPQAPDLPFSLDALSGLILAVVHGLAVQDFAEPDGVDVDEAFRIFLVALLNGMHSLGLREAKNVTAAAPAGSTESQ